MDVMQAITTRRSVRGYDSRPIPDPVLNNLRQALWAAPSACNLQPWRFVMVQKTSMRQQVAAACKKQMWMAEAPLIVVACGWPEKAYRAMGGKFSSLDVDLAIALDHLSLAAVAEGLGTCWIGAFDEEALKQMLTIPKDVRVVALMPVGYPKTAGLIRPVSPENRKLPQEIFCDDTYA